MSLQIATGTAAYLRRAAIGTGALTISTWFRFTALNSFNVIWSVFDGGTNYNSFYYDGGSGNVVMFANPSTQVDVIVGAAAGVWYWAAVTMTGTTAIVYASAGLGAISTTPVAIASNPGDSLDFGEDNPALGFTILNGQIVAPKIWQSVLTADQCANERMRVVPRVATIYSFPFALSLTNAGLDFAGRGNDFTPNAAPATSRLMPPIPWAG